MLAKIIVCEMVRIIAVVRHTTDKGLSKLKKNIIYFETFMLDVYQYNLVMLTLNLSPIKDS